MEKEKEDDVKIKKKKRKKVFDDEDDDDDDDDNGKKIYDVNDPWPFQVKQDGKMYDCNILRKSKIKDFYLCFGPWPDDPDKLWKADYHKTYFSSKYDFPPCTYKVWISLPAATKRSPLSKKITALTAARSPYKGCAF